MPYEKLGPIEILIGENHSKVPYSTSLLLQGNGQSVLIDCGSGHQVFNYLKRQNINEIYLTHYHLDHTWGTYLFPDAFVQINPYDYKKVSDLHELVKANGIRARLGKEKTNQWIEKQLHKQASKNSDKPNWRTTLNITDGCYTYDEPIEVAGTKMLLLHTPGHTEGFCCPYFPEHGVLFVGDYDLATFGPWYNDADSDIDQFIQSAQITLETDAEYFITAHHKGTFRRKEYEQQLKQYIEKINKREEKTKKAIQQGVQPKNIVYQEIFYLLKNLRQNQHYLGSEILGIGKHIQRLIRQGYDFGDYLNSFISHFKLDADYINYRSDPYDFAKH